MNPYEILKIQPGASDKEIKAAYKKLAKKYHPDVNGGDKTAEAKFKEVSEAYSMLTDKKPETPNFSGGFNFHDIFNQTIFDQMFRGASRQINQVRIDPELLIHGGTFNYTIQMVERDQQGRLHPIHRTVPITIEADTPALVQIAVPGTHPNHIFLQLIPGDTDKYRVIDVIHLVKDYTINAFQAMLGGDIEIELPNKEKISLRFPAGTQHGTVHRIPDAGLRLTNGMRGAFNVQLLVDVPAINGTEDEQKQQILDYLKRMAL